MGSSVNPPRQILAPTTEVIKQIYVLRLSKELSGEETVNTRILHTKLWKDEFFSELTPTEKLLFIYFLTNERVNIVHCYEVTDREIMFDTGVDGAVLRKAKEKFLAANKFQFEENFVFIVNAQRYESFKGHLNQKARENIFKRMPKSVLEWYEKCLGVFKGVRSPLQGGLIPPSRVSNTSSTIQETINKKSEIRNKKAEAPFKPPSGMTTLKATLEKKGVYVQQDSTTTSS